MIIDLIAFGLLLLSLYKGFQKGLVIAVFSFLAFFIGLTAALKLSAMVAAFIGNEVNISKKWIPFLAFVAVFIIVALLVRIGGRFLEGLLRLSMLGWLNKLGGVAFYLFIYIFIFSILLFYSTQLHILTQNTIRASLTYQYIEPLGPKMIGALGSVIPFFRDIFEQLLHFFQNISDRNSLS